MEIIFASGGTYLDDHCSGDHECIFFLLKILNFQVVLELGLWWCLKVILSDTWEVILAFYSSEVVQC